MTPFSQVPVLCELSAERKRQLRARRSQAGKLSRPLDEQELAAIEQALAPKRRKRK